jgi:hypothetical protein
MRFLGPISNGLPTPSQPHWDKVNSLCHTSNQLPPQPGQSEFTMSRWGYRGRGRRALPSTAKIALDTPPVHKYINKR